MYQSFLTFIKKHDLLQPDDRLLLAVSGGIDSMVMANLFFKAGYQFDVAHVNYHLRAEDSDKDQQLVTQWCQDHGIQLHLKEVSAEEYDTSESIQMIARRIRYDFFESLMGEFDFVATAHNANDNAETLLLNLTKGTGIHGLEGIAVKRGHLIRPLIYSTREEILAYAKGEGITWREDKSNQKNDYQRNMIRNEVIPLLKKINSNLEHTMEATIQRMQGAAQILNEKVGLLSERIETQGEIASLDLNWFSDDPKSIVLLSNLIKEYGFNYADAQDLGAAILRGESGKVFLSQNHEINLDRNSLLISKREEAATNLIFQVDDVGVHRFDDITMSIEIEDGNNFPMGGRQDIGYFDREKVIFPLKVRNWHQGDVFRPLGMQGKKKVSDFMIDSKIPLTLKKQVLVLESAGEIVWVIGHRMDDRYKVTSSTSQMLRIELNHYA